ncbi:hypothetical protein Pelo_11435 [Pelomyxa schiedti]|nr:hypothetical protein Pelo_11435 [Pelomyxa schiedti]
MSQYTLVDEAVGKVSGNPEVTWDYVKRSLLISTILVIINAAVIVVSFPLLVYVHPALGGSFLLVGLACHLYVMYAMYVLKMRHEAIALFALSVIDFIVLLTMIISSFTHHARAVPWCFCFICGAYILLFLWSASCIGGVLLQWRNMFSPPHLSWDVKRVCLIGVCLLAGLGLSMVVGFPITTKVNIPFGAALLLIGIVCPVYIAFGLFICKLWVDALGMAIFATINALGASIMGISAIAQTSPVYGSYLMLTGMFPLMFLYCCAALLIMYMEGKKKAEEAATSQPEASSGYVPPQLPSEP